MKILTIILLLVNAPVKALLSQEENKTIETGNNYYHQQQYDRAETEYQNTLEAFPGNNIAKFNLANALIRQNKLDTADKLLIGLNVKGNTIDLRSRAAYNRGVMFSQQKRLEESIELYKETLRLNPNDQEARENLQKALLELKKKNPPRKQEEKKKEQQQKPQPKPKISPREAQQQLKLLEQKEKRVQERLQKNSKTGPSQPKDW